MKFEDQHALDKPADVVIRMYTDRKFFERKYKETGCWDIEVLECEKTDTQFRIKCRYATRSSSNNLPAFAQKFLGESATVVQQDVWDLRSRTGRLDIEIKGALVRIVADMTLKDAAKGAVNAMQWNVSCGIPLIGGKLEKLVADDIKSKSSNDARVSRNILADY
jgi:hypothetical protein